EGDSVTIEAADGYLNYSWKNPSGTVISGMRTLRVASAGRYTVTAQDSSGCTAIGNIDVTVATKPKPTIDGPLIVCINSTHRYISVLKTGYRYSWSVEKGNLLDPGRNSTTSIQWTTLGVQRLTLRQTLDSSGCSDSITVLVRVVDHLDPKITSNGPRVFC